MNFYEVKRDLINFSRKVSYGLSKTEQKFIMNMIFGISSSGSVLISKISRRLKENIKLSYTIEMLCDNFSKFDNKNILMNNYYNQLNSIFGDDPVVLFDDSDITYIYGIYRYIKRTNI